MKSRVFIGSSAEGLSIAQHVAELLKPDMECFLWTDDIFQFNETPFHILLRQAGMFDFGILVATRDDFTISREKIFDAPRDNVIFEFGLFLGRLGDRRAFLLQEEGNRLPSDLLGITVGKFDRTEPVSESECLRDFVDQIRKTIQKRVLLGMLNMLPSTAIAISYYYNFVKLIVTSIQDRISCPGDDNALQKPNKLIVVIPATLDSDIKEQARHFYQSKGLQEIQMQSSGRTYPVYVSTGRDEAGACCIYDMPTTLLGIDKAIELYTEGGHVGKSADQELLEERELRNFRAVLQKLIDRDSYARKYVEIIIDKE
jgi:hypothetical protein